MATKTIQPKSDDRVHGMNRLILCEVCEKRICEATTEIRLDENVRSILGCAKLDMWCDLCNFPLSSGEPAYAVTTFDFEEDYESWEGAFVTPYAPGEEPAMEARREFRNELQERTPLHVALDRLASGQALPMTRDRALRIGAFKDVSRVACEAGIGIPVAVTTGVWNRYVRVPKGIDWQDEEGRLWDILWMLRVEALKNPPGERTAIFPFQLHVQNENREGPPPLITLNAVQEPLNDSWTWTVVLPEETPTCTVLGLPIGSSE